jgi:predicted metalloprotease
MRWRRGSNANIEDRRRMGGLGGGGLAVGGLGGVGAIIFLIVQLLSGGGGLGGIDVGPALDQFNEPTSQGDSISDAPDPDKDLKDFVGFVVDDVQTTWQNVFAEAGRTYTKTDLVLFTQATQTGCGVGSAQTGPFYCPVDSKVYLDLGFFRELRDRFGAPGDFAQAYVIAHEFGHHVQNLLGIDDDVRRAASRNPDDANALSIAQELQADCFAGVWGHAAFNDQLLERGDLEEGIDAAAAVGDDRIQKEATGRVNRETWTHGSSAQRVEWFKRGFDTGTVDDCNTFA